MDRGLAGRLGLKYRVGASAASSVGQAAQRAADTDAEADGTNDGTDDGTNDGTDDGYANEDDGDGKLTSCLRWREASRVASLTHTRTRHARACSVALYMCAN